MQGDSHPQGKFSPSLPYFCSYWYIWVERKKTFRDLKTHSYIMSQHYYTVQNPTSIMTFLAIQHWLFLGKIEKFAQCTEGQSVTCRWKLRRWGLQCIKFGAQSIQRSKVLQISSRSANPILSTCLCYGLDMAFTWSAVVCTMDIIPTGLLLKNLHYFRLSRKFPFDGSGKCRYWAGVAAHETQMGPNSCHFPRSASACCLTFHFPNF